MPRRTTTNLSPALVASALLHLGLAALALLSWQTASKQITVAPVVPVTIVDGPAADVREMVQAPEPAPAQSPTAEPAPTPEPPAPPAPRPEPTPAAAPRPADGRSPRRRGRRQRTAQKPPPAKQTPAETDSSTSTPWRAASPAPAARRARRRPIGAGRRGRRRGRPPARRAGESRQLSGGERAMLQAKLERLWNPNCEVAGATSVTVSRPHAAEARRAAERTRRCWSAAPGAADDAVLDAAATRAVSAAGRGAPYDELPADRYEAWKDIVFNFHAKSACSR